MVHTELRQMADDAGLEWIDLLEPYRGRRTNELGYQDDAWHPNEEGHRLAGEFLARQLAEKGLVPESPD